jgi:hypothetical protein
MPPRGRNDHGVVPRCVIDGLSSVVRQVNGMGVKPNSESGRAWLPPTTVPIRLPLVEL